MAVTIDDIKSISNNIVRETSNDTIVLTQSFEKTIYDPEFKVLGFLNGYMYCSTGLYVEKYTINGSSIAKVGLEVEHASFSEGCSFFYAFFENILYKISESMEILWSREFESEIHTLSMDIRGDVYVDFQIGRSIYKIHSDNTVLVYLDGSDDPEKDVVLYDTYITPGAGWLFVLGTEYWDFNNKARVFIDK